MPHQFLQSEGIILRATPFRDHDNILTLFTPEAGIIKLMLFGSRSKRQNRQGLSMPLTKVEAIYRENSGEIFTCKELALIDPYSHLRQDLNFLEPACDLLQTVCCSQLTGKPAPLLYALLSSFLDKIPQALSPLALLVSFRLKLLFHEGLATFPFYCASCGELLLTEAYTSRAEGFCIHHRQGASLVWSQHHLEQIYRLVSSQSYREICAEEVNQQLSLQVAHFFNESINM